MLEERAGLVVMEGRVLHPILQVRLSLGQAVEAGQTMKVEIKP
jgi:hypothetical protein